MFAHTLMDQVPYTVEKTNNFQKDRPEKSFHYRMGDKKICKKKLHIQGSQWFCLAQATESDYLMMCY
jgi:hypothetical protein